MSRLRARVAGKVLLLLGLGLIIPTQAAFCDVYSSAYERGVSEMGRRDYDGAITSFGEALGFDQTDKNSFFKRGQCFFHMGSYETALADFEHYLQFEPNNSDVLLWAGTAQAKMGKEDAATQTYLKAMRANPALVSQYEQNGGNDNQIIAVQPGSGRRRIELGGGIAVAKPSNAGAVSSYKRAIQLYESEGHHDGVPSSTSTATLTEVTETKIVNEHKGSTVIAKEPEIKAEQLTAMIRLDPDNPILYFRRGNAYRHLGKLERAVADYTDAIKLNPMTSQYYLARARTYNEQHQPELCKADIRNAQNVDPLVPKNLTVNDLSE